MRNQANLCISLIILISISVLIAGCASNQPEQAPVNLPTSAHATKTVVPPSPTVPEKETPVVTEVKGTPVAEKTPGGEVTPRSVPADMTLFQEGGVTLRYPDRFTPISSTTLEKMRTAAKSQGIDILTILTAADSKDSIQITRQTADSSIEGIYNEKMAIADEVAVNGSANVISMTFVKYGVEKETLPDGTGAVKVTAENTEKGTAVTYLLSDPGIIYNINFIYENPERAEEQESTRNAVIQTLQLS